MSTYVQQASVLTSRQMVMLLIIALHALAISALMAIKVVPDASITKLPLIGRFLPEERVPPPPDLGELVPSKTAAPRVQIAPPRPEFPMEAAREDIVRPLPGDSGPVEEVASPGGQVTLIPSTGLQFRAVRLADEYYPAQSLRLQEEGTAEVRVCVAPSGRIEGRPTIQASSGSRRLDAAALDWAREALVFTAATEGGVPVAACRGFRVNFTLR